MSDHDKFCPCSSRADKRQCRCAMLNAARADERERLLAQVRAMIEADPHYAPRRAALEDALYLLGGESDAQ